MNILTEITAADFITLYGLGFVCVLLFLIIGIMLLVTKNKNMINKNNEFKDEKKFVTLYGLVYIGFSLVMTVFLVIAMVNITLTLTMFLILGILALLMFLVHFLLQTKFRIK